MAGGRHRRAGAAAIGFAFWLWSVRSVDDPIDAHPVDAYAVVVSSPQLHGRLGIHRHRPEPGHHGAQFAQCLRATDRRTCRRAIPCRTSGPGAVGRYQRGAQQPAGRWLPIAIVAVGLLAVVGTHLAADRPPPCPAQDGPGHGGAAAGRRGRTAPAARVDGTGRGYCRRWDRLLATRTAGPVAGPRHAVDRRAARWTAGAARRRSPPTSRPGSRSRRSRGCRSGRRRSRWRRTCSPTAVRRRLTCSRCRSAMQNLAHRHRGGRR